MRKTLLTLLVLSMLADVAMAQSYSYRCWIDDDVSAATAGSATGEKNFEVDVSSLTNGIHALHVQGTSSSKWSSVRTRFFLKEEKDAAATARYWIDNDMGTMHNGVATSGIIDIDVSGISNGLHALHYQTIGANGEPSASRTRFFLKEEKVAATTARYWFDEDLTTMHNGVATSGAVELDVSTLATGLHAVHYQTMGADGTPSAVRTRFLLISEQPSYSCRLWIDNDEEHARSYDLSDQPFLLELGDLEGEHQLHVVIYNGKNNIVDEQTLTFEATPVAPSEAIEFADATAKAICVGKWDTNGDGELSVKEAAAVTSLGYEFIESAITSFDELRYFTGLLSIGELAFANCQQLASITIPCNVSTLGDGLFYSCNALTSLKVDEANKVFDSRNDCNAIMVTATNQLLYGCKSTVIPEETTSIGTYAFIGCMELQEVTLSDKITAIGASAFKDCSHLKIVRVGNTTPLEIGENTFTNRFNAALYVPKDSKAAYEKADYWKDFLTIIEETGEEGGSGDEEPTVITTVTDAIYIEPIAALSGKEFIVDIRLKNALPATTYTFDLILPEGVEIMKNEKGNIIDKLSYRHSDHIRTSNYLGNNIYRFSALSMKSSPLEGYEGIIRSVKMKVADGVTKGDYIIKICNALYVLPDGTLKVVDDTYISISFRSFILGDVNGNGFLDVGDAVTMFNYCMGKPTANFVEGAADLNGNNLLDLGDAVIIVNMLLGKDNESPDVVNCEAELVDDYWNNGYATFNTAVPQSSTDSDPSHCIYKNDLNAPFVTTNNGILSPLESAEYFFDNDHLNGKTFTIGSHQVTFSIPADGQTLSASIDGKPSQQIATITNGAASVPMNYVMLEETESAKILINDQTADAPFFAYISARGIVEGKNATVSFNGSDHFKVKWNAPIAMTLNAASPLLGGTDLGQYGSYVIPEQLVSLNDWRGRSFDSYSSYYGYYGVTDLTVDLADIQCDLGGTRGPLPSSFSIGLYDKDGSLYRYSGNGMPVNATFYQNTGSVATSTYGFMAFRNNGSYVAEDFHIFLKVIVTYKWGTMVSQWITLTMKAGDPPAEPSQTPEELNIETSGYNGTFQNYTEPSTDLGEVWRGYRGLFPVAFPQSDNDINTSNCVFKNDPNALLKTKNGILDAEPLTIVNYYFDGDYMNGNTYYVGWRQVKYTVSSDGLSLYASVDGNASEKIATITNGLSSKPYSYVTLLNSNNAKTLLNDQMETGNSRPFSVYYIARGKAKASDENSCKITFNDADHFQAFWAAPIEAERTTTNKINADSDVGTYGSYVRQEDLVTLEDCGNRTFKNNWYDYYGVDIAVDLNSIECNIGGLRQSLPATMSIGLYDKNGTLTASTGPGMPTSVSFKKIDTTAATSKFGYMVFKNAGASINESFDLYFNVIVTHKWGAVTCESVTVKVTPSTQM